MVSSLAIYEDAIPNKNQSRNPHTTKKSMVTIVDKTCLRGLFELEVVVEEDEADCICLASSSNCCRESSNAELLFLLLVEVVVVAEEVDVFAVIGVGNGRSDFASISIPTGCFVPITCLIFRTASSTGASSLRSVNGGDDDVAAEESFILLLSSSVATSFRFRRLLEESPPSVLVTAFSVIQEAGCLDNCGLQK